MTCNDITIRYNGYPFYGYEGYKIASCLVYISRNWKDDIPAFISCEHMQDESTTGYTEDYHQEKLHHSQRDDTRIYNAWLKEKGEINE